MTNGIPELPSSQEVARAVATEAVAKSRDAGRGSLLPALAPDSPLSKALSDSIAAACDPLREAVLTLAERIAGLEDANDGAP